MNTDDEPAANDEPTADHQAQAQPSPNRGAGVLLRVAKWVIAAIVTLGLILACRAAMSQWQAESQKLQREISQLRRQHSEATDPAQRRQLQQQIDSLRDTVPRLGNLRWDRIGIAGLLYAAGLIPPAFLLRQGVKAFGYPVGRGVAVAAQSLGHVGKYVPGKAMVVVLRAGVLSRAGVRPLAATISVFLETFLMMAVGGAVAGLVVLWLPVPRWIAASAVAVAITASLPTLPPILRRVAARISKVRLAELESQIGAGLFAAGWAWSLLSWILIGASFTTLVTAIPSATPLPSWIELYPVATAAICLAVVIGFASLLPGGAGVRELVLTTVLGAAIGNVHGILAAIGARVLFMVVEVIVAAISWGWLRRRS